MNNFWKKLPRPFSVLAPMENVTDFSFREIVSKYLPRPDVFFTEFTNVEALNSEGFRKTIDRLKFSKNQRPIVAQIWGIKPENYLKSAQLIENLGFDGIDINMGCPAKDVIKIGACSALIENHNLAKEIIYATKEGSKKLPISVKTRIGVREVVTENWISFLLEQKLSALTVHGRTSRQMSDVPANWDEILKTVKIKDKISPNTVIIGNGDVKDWNEIVDKYKDYGVDGVMIGRGIFSNPWVFDKENRKHNIKDRIKLLGKHIKIYSQEIPDGKKYDKLKKFFKMYISTFDGSSELRNTLMHTKNVGEVMNLLDNIIKNKLY